MTIAYPMDVVDRFACVWVFPYATWIVGWYLTSASFWSNSISIGNVLEMLLSRDTTLLIITPQLGWLLYFVLYLFPFDTDRRVGAVAHYDSFKSLPIAWIMAVLVNLVLLEVWTWTWRPMVMLPSPLATLQALATRILHRAIG